MSGWHDGSREQRANSQIVARIRERLAYYEKVPRGVMPHFDELRDLLAAAADALERDRP